jgi:hypothetical protein
MLYHGLAFAIALNSAAISTKEGLADGSVDQHLSINDFHAGSHQLGIAGRSVLFTIPPSVHNQKSDQ